MTTSEEIQNFCRNMCYLRRKYHLSKKSMAMLLGISARSLSLLEAGVVPKKVTVEILFRLHSVFQIPIDTLFLPAIEYTQI